MHFKYAMIHYQKANPEDMTEKTRFTVLEGGRDKQVVINALVLKAVSNSLAALPVNVRVFEEDTFLVLTVDPVMRYTEEHPIRLMTKVMEARPNPPGSVVTNKASWYAIIHDLDAEPTWRPEWIEKAYQHTLLLAEKKHIKRIALPLLGTVHGNLQEEKSLEMLVQAVQAARFQHLKKILIMVPQSRLSITYKRLCSFTT